MASMAPTVPRREADQLIRQVQSSSFLNRQLTSICQINGLRVGGVKAELQQRIVNLIQEAINSNDLTRFYQIRQSIENAAQLKNSPARSQSSVNHYNTSTPATPSSHLSHSTNAYMGKSSPGMQTTRDYQMAPTNGYRHGASSSHTTPSSPLVFAPSPFYSRVTAIGKMQTCEAMSQHRNSKIISLRMTDSPELQKCVDDRTYRVMVFCAGDRTGPQEITFPHQSELKVNGGDIKANLRGLKGKPGSTRPVDITSALRLKAAYTNTIEFTYALTTKNYYLLLAVCKITPVEDLVQTISAGRRIPKDTVIADLNRKAQDPDVVATSQVLSLKCPLSYMRLNMPCRGLGCKHIQCFDATSYLQLQEQGPQWLCPICNKSAPFDQLAVDEYVKDILRNTSSSLDAVTIEPNGRWSQKSSGDESRPRPSNGISFNADDDDDDDDLEISEISFVGGRRLETPKNNVPSIGTPASVASVSSTAPRGLSTTSNKRPAPAVIDLTLSSDEDDDEPIQRPTKRQSTVANGYNGPQNLPFLRDSPF